MAEEEQPKYGLTHPLKSYSFLWQHFHYYFEIAESYRRANGFRGKWKAVFGSPACMDQDIRPELEKRFLQDRSLQLKALRFRAYLGIQVVISVLLLMWLTFYFSYQPVENIVFVTLLILITLINCGALLEQRRWICYLEYGRLLLLSAYLFYNQGYIEYTAVVLLGIIVAEKTFSLGKRYQDYILQTR
jgi:alkylglycerol monooxygenase